MKPAAARPAPPSTAATLGEVFVWALVIVSPLLVVAGKESFRLPKLMAAEWLGLASVLCLAWSLRGSDLRKVWRLPVLQAVFPALLVATAGIWTTAHPLHVRESLFDLWIGAACLIGWSVGLERRRLERLLRGLVWPAAVLALIGILQFHRIWEPLRFTGIQYDPRLGITSYAGNPGDLSSYLVLPSLIALCSLWAPLSPRPAAGRWMTGLALALCLYGLALTQTLASLAAVAAGAGVLALLKLPRRKVVAGLAAAGILATALVLAVAPLRVRVAGKLRGLAEGDLNEVLTGRLDGWRAALWMMRGHPLAGVGHGAFLPEYVPAKLALLDRGVEFLPGQRTPVFDNAHNEILNAGAEWGIPGLLALAWGLRVLIRAARKRDENALAWSGLTALALLALAYFPFHVALVAFPALLFLAWVLQPERPEPGEEASGMQPRRSAPAPRAMRPPLAWVVVLLLTLALVAQTGRLRDRLTAGRMLRQVELVSMAMIARGELPRALVARNLEMLRRAAVLDPAQVGIPIARGTQYLLLGNGSSAAAAYGDALELEPRPEVHLNLGRALAMAGEAERARQQFRLALRLDPNLAPLVPPALR